MAVKPRILLCSLWLAAAYAVDPLFHQTSAQFDEGGARGLLLYNLGISHDLRIMFDSVEAEDSTSIGGAADAAKEVDLTEFAGEWLQPLRARPCFGMKSPSISHARCCSNECQEALNRACWHVA